ncbi:hypothetical protein IGI04_003444 [Brassica rapa subsp. trilocularis]|uniref:F-box associated beta-propeller type 1 domain-containing protein n=2 Tax=Brassica campestris TaxID=3711 RepID=A0ABQ7NYG2_BRACM|nr:hypothetical protein IGI04_003444 [Brassica rapa subsp. trilocularis]
MKVTPYLKSTSKLMRKKHTDCLQLAYLLSRDVESVVEMKSVVQVSSNLKKKKDEGSSKKMLMVSDLPFDLEKKISWHAVFRKSLQHNGQLLVKDGTLYSQSYFPRNTWLKQDETREFTLFLNDSVYSTVINLQGVHNNGLLLCTVVGGSSLVNLGDFMLGKVITVVSFVLDEENKVAVCCSTGKDVFKEQCTSISIIGENVHKHVYGQRIRDGLWPQLLNYVPSPVHISKKSTPKGKRKRKTRQLVKYINQKKMVMITDLPFDLEKKILARVPKVSRPQWQTTCKRWYAVRQDLLSKKHLARTGREFILLLNTNVFSTTINLQGVHNSVDPVMEFGGKLGSLQDSDDLQIHDIFYCKGLVLCTMVGKQMLVVCNPSNRETRYVEPRTSHGCSEYALGYKGSKSSCVSSYKILRYCRYSDKQLKRTVSEFELYDFMSDSWRVLDIDEHDWEITARGVSVKGNTYWVAKKKKDQFILSFDFSRERFGLLPLPYESVGPEDFINNKYDDTAVLSVVRDEQLSVLHQYLHVYSSEMKIWVSNTIDTKKVSWNGSWPHLMNYVPNPVQILRKGTRKSKRKRTTRSYEPEGSSARSVEETKVTPIDKAKRVFRVALNVPKEFRKRE